MKTPVATDLVSVQSSLGDGEIDSGLSPFSVLSLSHVFTSLQMLESCRCLDSRSLDADIVGV